MIKIRKLTKNKKNKKEKMKKIFLILEAVILTSCTTASNLTDSVKDKLKNVGNNPCWNETTKSVKIGCEK